MTTELTAQKAYLTVALGPNKKPVDSSRLLAPNPALFLCQEWWEYYIIDSLQVANVGLWDHMLTTKLRQGDIVCGESVEHYILYSLPAGNVCDSACHCVLSQSLLLLWGLGGGGG